MSVIVFLLLFELIMIIICDLAANIQSILEKMYKDWFNKNLVAIPGGIFGNCSACIFRNAKPYCAKMNCSYCGDDFVETVYWVSEKYYPVNAWPELSKFFDSTNIKDVMDISGEAAKMAILKKQRTR